VPTSALYRRVWRWHFYAGLVCLPFLLLLAVTSALYLFKDPIESVVYARLRSVQPGTTPSLDAEALVAHALQATPGGPPVRFTAPERAGRSAEVGIHTADGTVAVYLDPSTGRVLGSLADDSRLMEVVKGLHSLTLAGPVANHWIEIVAGWAIVLVVTGVFLWWPRGGGAYRIRGRPRERTWWRDLHAVTGVTAAGAVLFLAVTGMPWSAFWGQQFGRLTSEWGLGAPQYVWGKPQSAKPLAASLGEVPWALAQVPVPSSDPHAHHGAVAVAPPPAPATKLPKERAFGLNDALRTFERLGMPPGTPVALPAGPTGVYSALRLDDEVQAERVVHLDRYSGAVLADVGYPHYGAAARATAWGISLHTGRQFGWMNQLVMLAACLSIVTLAVSSAVMWWKRRPQGRLAAPPRREGDRAALAAVAVAVLLGVLYPLLGASLLVALALDLVVPRRWHERFGL
jgi:uncharacterized iron-regulated membrane protein